MRFPNYSRQVFYSHLAADKPLTDPYTKTAANRISKTKLNMTGRTFKKKPEGKKVTGA